ncbi:Interferon-induced GTP-binding protein Mx [Hypsizygus marmoreus]|uniref:Interferon-induced GTP-binding protein Mx n=1 Tax=Hypsizygus marmoreus TaxID=39966 RepID=A0A369JJF3_HYPMA|nr:Interferon-induced GTP-binding protein Mx [Hypsizygus marmoreus]
MSNSLAPDSPSSSPGEDGIGLSDPRLIQDSRRMLDLVNRLHSTGVHIDIDLPRIAVIGSQSAGKSSLIESISGITLPRATGTCTRCPTECRLSRSTNAWKCTVSLTIFEDGKLRTEQFGTIITEKSDVEERIRRAQRAILNPGIRKSKGAKYYLTDDDEGSAQLELSFSSDFVSLQISGPDVADLSFCDLPGLIAGVGMSGNTGDIDLVKNLVATYIKKPSCIILLTVACETDFQNQGAQEIAKAYDPDGKRTIGVLTKPDRIPAGEESNWISLIRNEKEPLENGWFCVKQPASADLKAGISWATARQREDEFFSSTAAWTELDSIYQKYLRTGNLVARLSAILSNLISKRLPQIQEELENSILFTREILTQLPPAPSKDPRNEIAKLLYGFVRDVDRHAEGVPDEFGLLQSIRPAQDKFKQVVRATAPQFLPFEKRYQHLKSIGRPSFLLNEEEYEDPVEEEIGGEDDVGSDVGSIAGERHVVPTKQIYIDEVMIRADQARTRELPGNYPFVVQATFIKSIIKQWNAPANMLCRTVFLIVNEHIQRLVHVHFGSFGQGQLEQRVRVLIQDHLMKCMERTEERIQWLLDLEDRPFSLNTHYLTDYRDKFLAYYKGAREKDRNAVLAKAISAYSTSARTTFGESSPQPTGMAKVLAGLVEIGVVGTKPADIAKVLPADEMEPALKIMADVRAYFQVAYKRIIDNIPLAIDHELVRGIERNVLHTLNTGLGINGPEAHRICKELAQENPNVAGRREELSKKLERMIAASQQLLRIGG